ncbi:MAG: hypothetical protein GX162_01020 [Firmicutes bacterium]|nr:hypothetical protein [Bacillota bacterium]
MRSWRRIGIVALFMVAILTAAATAGGKALQVKAPMHVYAHLYRPFPAETGREIWVQVSTRVGPHSGSSWTPSVFLYWDAMHFVGLGQESSAQFRINTQGFRTIGRTTVDIEAGDWVDLRIGLTETILSLSARDRGGDWVILQEILRPPIPATLPAEILLGKGFGNNTPTYPNPHLDNSYSEQGATGVVYLDDLIVTVDGETVLHETFDTLSGWSVHQDPSLTESVFSLVSEEIANAAFADDE